MLPAGKVDVVRRLQDGGRVVAMAGDGVNDAAALAQADLGLAMGTGADAAIEASDLTLVRGDLLAVPDAILLSRRTLATIKGNLFWAFGYNTAVIPLAALGFLNPLIAGAAMAFSSVFVVSNSLRLRRFRPARRAQHGHACRNCGGQHGGPQAGDSVQVAGQPIDQQFPDRGHGAPAFSLGYHLTRFTARATTPRSTPSDSPPCSAPDQQVTRTGDS